MKTISPADEPENNNNNNNYEYSAESIESLINLIYWYAQEYHFNDFGHASYIGRLTEFLVKLNEGEKLTEQEFFELTLIHNITDAWLDY